MAKKLKEQTEEVKTKIKKLGPLKIIILALLGIGTICAFVFYDKIFGADSLFFKQYPSEFLTALMHCIPRAILSVQVVTIVLIITSVILGIISHIIYKTQRGITVSRLICNLIRWIVGIVLIIVVLAIWGVDTTALITGAGVLTLVVGLGMQSLISDVVAGLFIVFENEFNVGDIITIDGFRGEVVSIGIRTTKLKALGNIKIFNNSDIRSVLNQTVEPSVAFSYVCVEFESLPLIESVIKENLSNVKVEGVIGNISYDGVDALGSSGATLQFSANCLESDIFSVRRGVNMGIQDMLTSHGIKIAINQVAVRTDN